MSHYIFYVGPEHHKIHLQFTQELIGGEYFISGHNSTQLNTYENIKHLDGENVIWFFADLYENIIPFLRGKSIFIPHGLAFKPYLSNNVVRTKLLINYVDQIWSAGYIDENKYIEAKIDIHKIERIGYTVLFRIPDESTILGSIFITVGWFEELVDWRHMLEYLTSIPPEVVVYLSTHPSMPQDIMNIFKNLANKRSNFVYISDQSSLLQSYAVCSRAIVGFSSVATPFHFLEKPVIYIKNRNRFPLFQWYRLKMRVSDELFFKVLKESTKLLAPIDFDTNIVMNAKVSPSATKIFYESNWDKEETIGLIKEALIKLH